MAESRFDAEVIVVGAGPVGLMLAAELRLGGAHVLVLEQRRSQLNESRASTLHARTMEIFESRGLLPEFGAPPVDPVGHFGGIPLDLSVESPWSGQWKVPQTRTEAVLEEWALDLGVEIRCGHRATALSGALDDEAAADPEAGVVVHAEGREGPVRLRARWLVACDGQDSTVRRLTGVAFPGHDALRELIRADVAGIDVPNRRFQRLPNGLAIAARRPDGVTRVMAHAFGSAARPRDTEPEFAEVVQVWKEVTGEDISGGTPEWVNAFGDATRQLERYRHGRVLFAGDAAHQQMPVGGQALNLGLQDAHNLGWKLAQVLRVPGREALLDTYDQERRAVGGRTLSNIEAQARLLLGGPEVEPLRSVLAEVFTHEPARALLAGMITGVDVRYPMPEDGGERHDLLGARLPTLDLWCLGGWTSPSDLLRSGRGLLLDLRESGAPDPLEDATGWADRITLVTGRQAPADRDSYGPRLDRALLVRPDGHIAWTGTDSTGLLDALTHWFGPAA
jgi:oxygenase